MIKNYFKIAWHNLIKDKQFSLLNLVGLSTGLACVLLIYLWVSDELSIDKFNANDNRLYQVLKKNADGDGTIEVVENTQGLLAQSIVKEFPEVEFATGVKKERDQGILSTGDNALYASEQRVSLLSGYFAGIAVLISCLGLFGLAAFTAQKRQKEIGIRKVIGASVSDVVTMLSKDFLLLVCLALLIAIPISWWAANEWLHSFAYRIIVSPSIFVITGVSVVLITLLTISFQSVKAAVANPVKSLRTE